MDLLVVGGSGFLGAEVVSQARAAGHRVVGTFHERPAAGERVDIRSREDVAGLVRRIGPEVIVNAAYRKADWATTADGGANVALAAAGRRLVHVSSDLVFSGGRCDETRPPDPTTPYGAAKAAAETAVRAIAPDAVIARTSLIFGPGSPHERHVHELAGGAGGVLFTDVVRCPVHVADLAAAILELAAGPYRGIQHLAGPDALSRYELGVLVARRDGLGSALPGGAGGASDIRLDCTATRARLATRLRGAREFLAPAGSLRS